MVRRLAIAAGDATLDYFDECGGVDVRHKEDGSPVTKADEASEKIIEKGLFDILPEIPMIGEEAFSAGNYPDISTSDYFWLVDPLDGTKEFIAGRADYTVNIALIHKGNPILGVIYAPAIGDMYCGCVGGKAIKWSEDDDLEKEIRTRKPLKSGLVVLASRSHSGRDDLEDFLTSYKVSKTLYRGSSIKMCLIAEGKGDLYPRLGATGEWDTAAAHAILNAAGGAILDMNGKALTYGHVDRKFINPNFIAIGRND